MMPICIGLYKRPTRITAMMRHAQNLSALHISSIGEERLFSREALSVKTPICAKISIKLPIYKQVLLFLMKK